MQQRSSRGIQYEDVAQAADALLQEGVRPTIERIRLHIGRGSPNTVSPLLEEWFSGLGKRLGGAQNRQSDPSLPGQGTEMPDTVLHLAQALWAKASSEAQAQSELACVSERARLEAEAQRLQEADTQLHAREMVMDERLTALKTALHSCQQQLADSNAHWQASLRTLAVRESEIAASRSALDQARSEATALQQSIHSQHDQMLAERTAMQERHHSTQQHWLAEVDRARQEMRKSALQVEQSNLQRSSLQKEVDHLRSEQHTQQLEHALHTGTLRSELAAAVHDAAQSKLLLQKLEAEKEKLEPQQSRRRTDGSGKSENSAVAFKTRRTTLNKLHTPVAPVRRSLKKMRR